MRFPQDSKDLIGVPVAQCECRSTGDPRSGLTIPDAGCPQYCTDNIFNRSCICDSDQTDYTECEADKAYPLIIDCNGVHGSSVKPNTCICIDGYAPTGCTCPRNTDLNQLDGVPPGQCKCLDEEDPRVGISCPSDKIYPTLLNCTEEQGQSLSPDTSKCNNDYSPFDFNCYMKYGVSYKIDFALSCHRCIKLESNEQRTTISILKEYLNSYAFIDTSLNPPGAPIKQGKHAVNININLDKINKITFTNTFDFYEQIMILLNNLKDPHTIFTPPCVSKVYYMFPQITVNQSKTDYSLSFIININEQNYSLDKINILGQKFYDNNTYVDVEGTYPTLEAIARWADEEVSISRNSITNPTSGFGLNHILHYPQHRLLDTSEIDELNVQLGGLPNGTPAVDSGGQNDQNARAKGREWLQPFTNKGLSPEEEARRKEILALGKAVLEGYYHVSLDKLDQTGERASEETRLEIRRREQMIRTLIHEDKAAKAIAGEKDSPVERETQIFAIHAQKMIEAAIVSLIGEDNVSAMNSLLSAHHACRIVAGDAQKRREVAVVPSGAKEALLTGGGLTLLLGSESKAIVAEALKSSKLISTQQTSNIQQVTDDKTQQLQQQQVPFMNNFQQNQRYFNNKKFNRRFSNFNTPVNQFVPYNSQTNYGQWGNQQQQLPGWNQQMSGWGNFQPGYNPNMSQAFQQQQQQQDNRFWQPGQKRGLNMAPLQLPKQPLENRSDADQQKNQ
ncbi:MAG: hypothetical protein EZS28_004083 [Streblomastix strix]|uniref:Uncharacterized protein n=1 Tax=Streblomastix strix TaxID=222440 RepID=A0A5J4WZH3_9EUKA|nr:MAG: hypothetical protein EZS28_004083 [Streblomastix strix]